MFCRNCGSKVPDGAQFCENCGSKIEYQESSRSAQGGGQIPPIRPNGGQMPPKQSGSGKGIKAAIAVIIALTVIIIGVVGYNTVGLAMSKNSAADNVDESKVKELIELKDQLESQWDDLGVTDVSEKKDILKQMKDISDDADTYVECKEDIDDLIKDAEEYNLDQTSYSAYTDILDECKTAVKEDRAMDAIALYEQADEAKDDLIEANEQYIEDRMELYESINLKDADKDTKKDYDKNMKAIKDIDDDDDYAAYKEAFQKMDETIYMYIDPENDLTVEVQQIDASEFPKVKLYLNVKDPATGEVPSDLENSFFYINKEDANAKYVKQVVTDVNQLNEKEALKVDMVADVSGSMEGSPLAEAKTTMSNFVNSVQFEAGDLVELTSFSTGVHLEQEFTGDKNLLLNDINGLITGNMTSLYDALYTAVERVAAQNGARCVIAFTDGMDNYSSNTAQSVVDVANRYHIPVFIIGIGDVDYSEASWIAGQTGGKYYNSYDAAAMQDIYDEIYRMEKEMYLLEYEDNTGAKITDTANIQVGYRSLKYGGECKHSYVPNTLVSVDSTTLYTDGPEAVVEKYMKNFDDAMNNKDFSYIEGCLLPGSSIYQEQAAYVQKGFSEQLDSYEIVSTDYSDNNNCVVTTRETYFVQVPGKPLQLMTQQCQYSVVNTGGEWKMTAFVGKVNVLSRINQ